MLAVPSQPRVYLDLVPRAPKLDVAPEGPRRPVLRGLPVAQHALDEREQDRRRHRLRHVPRRLRADGQPVVHDAQAEGGGVEFHFGAWGLGALVVYARDGRGPGGCRGQEIRRLTLFVLL